jgi:hypothetical protein
MGFLDTLFGGGKQLPLLEASSPTAAVLERSRTKLEDFAARVKDKLEIVPGERGTYVFVGKPPDAFGIVWFHDGEESNFKILMKERGLSAQKVQILSDQLRDAYKANRAEPRYAWKLGGRDVTVTPSASLEQQVAAIIRGVTG